jgi:hypothetical protein
MGVSSQYVASSASIADGAVSEAKLAAEACSAAKMKKEGTATHVLTSNGAGAIPSYQAVPAGTSSLTLVGEYSLASNTLTMSSLSGQYMYIIVGSGFNASDNVVLMTINGDTTATHYTCQQQTASSTTLGGARVNTPRIIDAPATNGSASFVMYLWRDRVKEYAKALIIGQSDNGSGANENRNNTWMKYDATITEITSITISGASTCTGKVSLYKSSLV